MKCWFSRLLILSTPPHISSSFSLPRSSGYLLHRSRVSDDDAGPTYRKFRLIVPSTVEPSSFCDVLLELGCMSASVSTREGEYWMTDSEFERTGMAATTTTSNATASREVDAFTSSDASAESLAGAISAAFGDDSAASAVRIEEVDVDTRSHMTTSFEGTLGAAAGDDHDQVDLSHLGLSITHGGLAVFGDGRHSTTRLCLQGLQREAMRRRQRQRQRQQAGEGGDGAGLGRILDFGAGTGILALAAMKLGFRPAVAVEIDSSARTVAAENARRNDITVAMPGDGCVDRASVISISEELDEPAHDDPQQPWQGFDLIVSNMPSNTLCAVADTLVSAAALAEGQNDCRLLVAGFPGAEAGVVQERFEGLGAMLLPDDTIYEAGWALLSFSVPPKHHSGDR